MMIRFFSFQRREALCVLQTAEGNYSILGNISNPFARWQQNARLSVISKGCIFTLRHNTEKSIRPRIETIMHIVLMFP